MIHMFATIIAYGNTYVIKDEISKIEFSGQDRSDTALPSWGIISNSGRLEMYDVDGSIGRLSREGKLARSPIYLDIDFGYRTERLGNFIITSASQDRDNSHTKIEFKDVLDSWQRIQMNTYIYPYVPREVFATDIIDEIKERAGQSLYYYDDTTQRWLENLYIEFPIIDSGSLWSQMTKICEVSACYIFCDSNGVPNIRYGGGT